MALEEVKGREYDHLVKDIEDIQDKSKKAYVRLYEKVGDEIGLNFIDKLDHLSRQKSEADKLLEEHHKGGSAQVELSKLQNERMALSKMKSEKEKEYLRSEYNVGGKNTTIGDLFTKYGV